MNKNLLSIIYLLISITTYSYSQSSPIDDGILPASPNAESLAKYVHSPVNTYNGIPNISIPLYTISSRDLSIPIGISYHSKGIKVEEDASWVGLGWTLNVGGAITQTIRGKDDLSAGGYGNVPGGVQFPDFVSNANQFEGMMANVKNGDLLLTSGPGCHNSGEEDSEGWDCGSAVTPMPNFNYPFCRKDGNMVDFSNYFSSLGDQYYNNYDWQPDVFGFNFMGNSGKFMFDELGNIVIVDKQDIKFYKGNITDYISLNIDNTEGFTAVLNDGSQYYFGAKEEVIIKGTNKRTSRTFHLSHIISTFGEVAIFDYIEVPRYTRRWGISQSQYLWGPSMFLGNGMNSSYIESEINPKYLSSIRFSSNGGTSNNGREVVFDLEGRDDLGNANEKKLKFIRINGNGGTQLRNFEFNYSYFNGSTVYGSYLNYFNDDTNKRLKLGSIVESNGSEFKPPYTFEYNNTPLPSKTAFAQDYWGYFNGEENNTHLIPDFRNFYVQTAIDNALFSFDGANRDPNPDFINAGILEKINYPTGGYQSFEFEPNEYSNFTNLPYLNDIQLVDNLNLYVSDNNYSGNSITSFDVPIETNVHLDVIISCGSNSTSCLGADPNIGNLYGEYSHAILFKDAPTVSNIVEIFPHNSTQGNSNGSTFGHDIILPPGTYFIEAYYPDDMPGLFEPNFNGGVSIRAKVPVFNQVTKKIGGGLRVKKITLSDGSNSDKNIIKEYKYSHEYEGEEYSWGKIMSPPVFLRQTDRCYWQSNPNGNNLLLDGKAIRVSNTSFVPESFSAGGNNIGYSEVEIIHGECTNLECNNPESNIGKTKLQYFNLEDNFYVYSGRPSSLPTVSHGKNGKLLEQVDFDNQGTEVRRIENEYELSDVQEIKGMFFETEISGLPDDCNHVILYWYRQKAERFDLINSKETLDGLTTVTDYIYNNIHRQPISTIRYLESDPSQSITTSYLFANDLLGTTTGWENIAFQRLIDKNMITIPLETHVSGMVNSGNKTKYKCFNTFFDAEMPLPYETYSKKGSTTFDLDGTFLEYDNRGNIKKYLVDGYFPSEFHSFDWWNDLLSSKTFGTFSQNYTYYYDSQKLKTSTNSDSTSMFYDYDDLQRLNLILDRGVDQTGSILKSTTDISYQIGGGNNSITSTTTFDDAPSQTSVQVMDGLGRLTSSTLNGLSSKAYSYDKFGRVDLKQYLPGSFTRLIHEYSPLSRITKEIFPDGSDIETEYGSSGNYFQVSTTDENDNTSKVLTDLLQRTKKSIDALDNITEYEYDLYGNIGAVFPPNYTETQEYYDYTYDQYNRLVTKIIPSGGTHEFRYNAKDQLVASQTGSEWIGTIYDDYGRPDEAGKIAGDPSDPNNISIVETYSKTYYDDYGNLNVDIKFADYPSSGGNTTTVKGKVVGTKVRVLGTDYFIYTTTAYDEFGRSFKTNSSNLLDGNDLVESDLNLADLPEGITRTHNTLDINSVLNTQVIQEDFTYDNFLRPYTHRHSLNGADQVLLSLTQYNGIGQLIKKNIGQADGINGFIQNIDYQYNTRGWLTHINGINMTGQDTSIPICDDGVPPPPCGEKCDYSVEFLFQGDDAVIDITYGELDPSTNTYSSTSAALNYPYFPINNDFTQLENDLIAWMFSEGIPNQGVDIVFANGIYTLNIYQTDAKFQTLLTFANGASRFVNSCRPQVCDYTVNIPAVTSDNVTNITYNNVSIPLNYPYNSAPSNGLSTLVADLTAWLNTANIAHQGVSVVHNGDGFTFTIYQVDIQFRTITTDIVGEKEFNQVNCLTSIPPIEDDICIKCINDGYECDRCPYIDVPDKCIPCADLGFDDCEECPLLAKLIRPTSIKVEYNHPALANNDISTNASILRVTENSYRTLYNDQVIAAHKTLNTVVGEANISSAPLTHVMEIELGDQWINEVTLDVVKGNIQSLLMSEIESAGIDELAKQVAFAEAVVEIAASTWGGASGKLDDGAGGQTPTPSSLPINNPDMFSMQLTYADGHAMVNSPIQKNGNISGMIWQTPGRNTQSYSFEYDEINRLKDAYHQDVISGGQLSTDNKYGVEITYDKVGNINTLNRRGVIDICPTPTPSLEYGAMDALSYNYITKPGGEQTNRLQSIEEFANVDHGFKSQGGEYTYDGFGNMTTDAKTGATITYNHLNLPESITVSGEGAIHFVYDAAGIKLKKIVSGTDGYIMHYIGGIEYKDNEIESVHHAEGRITFHENTETGEDEPLYEYYLKDHLGNIRVTLADKDGDGYIEPFNVNPNEHNNGTGGDGPLVDLTNTDVLQETHYYPFGMTMEGEWQNIVNGPENTNLYNGKELNSEFGLDWSDYGARMYDASIGRWNKVDLMSDIYVKRSPYCYVLNNPIKAIDPDGNLVIFVNGYTLSPSNKGKKWYWRKRKRTNSRWSINPKYETLESFDTDVMKQFNDNNVLYFNGSASLSSTANNRFKKGYKIGQKQAREILNAILDENGNITETIKIVTHSMGAAYGRGLALAILEEAKKMGIKGNIISLIADFDPFQAASLKIIEGVKNQQFLHDGWLADQEAEGAEVIKNDDEESHSILSFSEEVAQLEPGLYKWNDKTKKWECTNCENNDDNE